MSRHTGITTEQRKKKQTTATSDKKDRPKIRTSKETKTQTTKQENSLYQPKTNTYYDLSHPCDALQLATAMGFSQVESSAPEALQSEVTPTPESQKAHGCVSLKRYGCFPMGFLQK